MENGYEPTTTHAAWGSGNPRLLVRSEDRRFVHELVEDRLTIGSDAGNGLVLPEIDALHATVDHDARDEYVLTLIGLGDMNANPEAAATGADGRTEVLRTGARFTAGPWTFVFMRDEFADHGRPYGGREGGELSDQPPQSQRPDYVSGEPRDPQIWEVQDD